MKHRAPPPAGVLPKLTHHPAKVIGVTFAVLLGLCCCGNALGEILGDDKPAAAPSASAGTDHIVAVPSGSAPTSASPSPTASATAKPTPKPTRSNSRPTLRRTTRPSIRNGVHPGAFCDRAGATGRTSMGKLLICKRSPGDDRLRWRAA